MENPVLKEVPVEDYPALLSDLKADFPVSVNTYNFLKTIIRQSTQDAALQATILCLNGDFRSKFVVYYSTISGRPGVGASIHKWSHREDDNEICARALKQTDKFPWHSAGICILAMTPETDQVVVPVIREIWKDISWKHEPRHRVYWLPKEEAMLWKSEAPPGTYISFLNETHAKEVDDVWPHRHNGSLELIGLMIRLNFGIGLFDSTTNELMAWALHWFYGAIGLLQTKDKHKKKGYGAAVLRALTKEIAVRGDDVHLNIVPENFASISLVEKLNYRFAFESSWIFNR